MWYTSIPTSLPFTTAENEEVKGYKNLSDNFKTSSGTVTNLMLLFIEDGYSVTLLTEAKAGTPAAIAELVGTTWQDNLYLKVQQAAWERVLAYYETIK